MPVRISALNWFPKSTTFTSTCRRSVALGTTARCTIRANFSSTTRRRVAGGPSPVQREKVKVWPFVAITVLGSGAYVFMVRQRAGVGLLQEKKDNQDCVQVQQQPLLLDLPIHELRFTLVLPSILCPSAPEIKSVKTTYKHTKHRLHKHLRHARPSPPQSSGQLPAPKKDKPTFSSDDVTVIFVLGGPGAGKGTQCANLVRDYNFTHLSAGDLLRAEQDRPNSQFGSMIKDYIKEGEIVPMEVTVQLLENAMTDVINEHKSKKDGSAKKGKPKFLVDGFPRKMDQATRFEETVCLPKCILFFDCPEEEMEKRLLKRGETSGRSDDNAESIKKRFKVFEDTSMKVVNYYEKEKKVLRIMATKTPDDVYADTKKQLEGKYGDAL